MLFRSLLLLTVQASCYFADEENIVASYLGTAKSRSPSFTRVGYRSYARSQPKIYRINGDDYIIVDEENSDPLQPAMPIYGYASIPSFIKPQQRAPATPKRTPATSKRRYRANDDDYIIDDEENFRAYQTVSRKTGSSSQPTFIQISKRSIPKAHVSIPRGYAINGDYYLVDNKKKSKAKKLYVRHQSIPQDPKPRPRTSQTARI